MNTKFDIYSDFQVPFAVAAFCRGRRYMPSVVSLGAALRKKTTAEKELKDAQEKLEEAEREVRQRVDEVQTRIVELGQDRV